MAFFKGNRTVFNGLLAAAGGATALAYFYPSIREVVLSNLQIDEADAFTVKKIEGAYSTLEKAQDCNSLLKKYLTRDVLDDIKYKKTKLGASLYEIIRSGVFNLDSKIGVFAADVESYTVFGSLFNPIIEEYHKFSSDKKQPSPYFGEDKKSKFPSLDPDGKFISSTRIRCCRTIAGYPFNPLLTQDDYIIMQEKVLKALKSIEDEELKGTYYKLEKIPKDERASLIDDGLLFKDDDKFVKQAEGYKFWPKGRGTYFNKDKTFSIWVNEKDHLKIISMEQGSNVQQVFDRLARGIKEVNKNMSFTRDKRLGWLTFSPANLGSSIRASVHIYLPKVSARKDFQEICDKLNLEIREIPGSKGGVYDISNKIKLGITEYDAVKQMYDGVKELIRLEKETK
uniref:arginine kinase n=1 Tax=Syphacia muris TaxID=451379 RepID=A0A0N5AFF9_9BILA